MRKIIHSLVAAAFLFLGSAPAFADFSEPHMQLKPAQIKKTLLQTFLANAKMTEPERPVPQRAYAARPDFRQTVAFIQNGAPLYMRELNQIEKAAAAPFNAYSVGTLGGSCNQQGSIMFQSANGQSKCLGTGVSGQVVKSGGPGADIAWLTTAGTGTVTSVALTMPAALFAVAGTPVTSAGTLAVSLQTQTANTVWAGPGTGVAAAPSFRALVNADIPAPTLAALGGVEAINAVASNWIRSISTSGIPALSQPNFTDLAGSIASGQISANLVTNAALAQMAAATIKGNPTAALANGSDFTINGLTDITTPNLTLDTLLIFNHTTGTLQKTNAQEISTVIGGGVASFNSRTGAVVPAVNDYTSQQIAPITTGAVPACGSGKVGELCAAQEPVNSVTVTFTNGSANINWPANTLPLNGRVSFSTTGALPTGFVSGTNYFVTTIGTNIQVSATLGGSAIVAGSAGSGVQTGSPGANLGSPAGSTAFDVVAISLGAGDWHCGGSLYFNPDVTTTYTVIAGYVGTTAHTVPIPLGPSAIYSGQGATLLVNNGFQTGTVTGLSLPEIDIALASTANVFLDAGATFATANLRVGGNLWCRRAS